MGFTIHPDFSDQELQLKQFVANFETSGDLLGEPARNAIRVFDLNDFKVNIKSFRIPLFINGLIYGTLRKSKARRSYEYGLKLLQKGIGTPKPIGYLENGTLILKDSYYLSQHIAADLTFRELTTNPEYPEHEIILRQFMAFQYKLHENGVEFLDNTPGNTLIKKRGNGQYEFFLVDLNRMKFHQSMSFEQRIINLSKLTKVPHLIEIMSDEYAKLSGHDYTKVYSLLNSTMLEFQRKLTRKRELKKSFKRK